MTRSPSRSRYRHVLFAATASLCAAGTAVAVAPTAHSTISARYFRGLQLVVTPESLPTSGGAVALRLAARGATTCWFAVRGSVGYMSHASSCDRGVLTGSIQVAPLPPGGTHHLLVTGYARRGDHVSRTSTVVSESALVPTSEPVTSLQTVDAPGGPARPARPRLSLAVSPAPPSGHGELARSGAKVLLRLVSFGAQACWFAVAGDLADHTTSVSCSRGFTTGELALPVNRRAGARVVKLIAYAKNVDGTVRSIVEVIQAGTRPAAPGASVGPSPRTSMPTESVVTDTRTLGPSGGSLTLHLAAIGAKTCWFDVPGDPSAATPRPCADGFVSLDAVLGQNDSALARQLTIVAFASDGAVVTRRAIAVTEVGKTRARVGTPGVTPVVVTPVVVTPTLPAPSAPATPSLPVSVPPSYSPPPSSPPPSSLAITTTTLPGATASSAYSTNLAASGGTSPYTWSLASGSALPAGLGLAASGSISGTPMTSGTTSVTFKVTDATGTSASATLGLVVAAASTLAILTTELPSASVYGSYTADLVASGGTSPYTWSLASGSSLPTNLSLSSSGTLSGSSLPSGVFTFTVTATDATSPAESVSQLLELYVVSSATSANWSGYVATPGPMTAASGTFNVPSVGTSSGTTYTSIWVGIDGDTNNDLIQAGIQVEYTPGSGVTVFPWWEILHASETPISSMTVSVGDQITVAIDEVSSGMWSIEVADDTMHQSFTTTESYSGPGTSAEWIVERPEVNGSYSTLGDYAPDVAFTGISYTGSAQQFTNLDMTESPLGFVSTTSPIDYKGFNTAYGPIPPAYPA